jgi:hypothetical protein
MESEASVTKFFVAALVSAAIAAPLAAQRSGGSKDRAEAQKLMQQSNDQTMKLQAAMADARAKANHPGDNKLSCDELANEAVAQMQQPEVRAQIAQNSDTAKSMQEDMDKAMGTAKAKPAVSIATTLMFGVVNTFIPGMSLVTGRAEAKAQESMQKSAREQAEVTNANTAQNMTVMMDGLIAIMPQMMRTHRVMELGQAKKCEWAQGLNASGGMPASGSGRPRR